MGRVHAGGRAYRSGIGKTGLCIHPFQVSVQLQHPVEERGREVERCRVPLEVRRFEDTVLVRITDRYTERRRTQTTVHADVMVGREGNLVDFFLPVGVRVAQRLVCVAAFAVLLLDACAVFVGVHDFDFVFCVTHRDVAVVGDAHFRLAAFERAFLRRDDDHAVRGA